MRTLPVLLAGVAASTTFASAAIAGPSLSGITNTRIQGSVAINTNFGESFSVNGDTSGSGAGGAITPFAATVGLDATQINPTFNGGDPTATPPVAPTIAAAATNSLVGNVGTAILAVTFQPEGSSLGVGTADNSQVTATAGLVQLGGSGTIGGRLAFNLPSNLVLNQEANGIPSIVLQGAGASDGLIGASITGTQVGPSNLTADLTIVNQLINSLTAF
jgi:hypothetical protein